MNSDICNAIRNKDIISFNYDGGIRIVEPYCYGVSTAGNLVLRCFQIDGYSLSGKPMGWKLFKIGEMSSISLTEKKIFNIRSGYNPNDKGMIRIICNI